MNFMGYCRRDRCRDQLPDLRVDLVHPVGFALDVGERFARPCHEGLEEVDDEPRDPAVRADLGGDGCYRLPELIGAAEVAVGGRHMFTRYIHLI